MTNRTRATFILLFALTVVGSAAASTIVVPAGTSIHFKLRNRISTATARSGQTVPASLTAPIVVSGVTVARAGSPAEVRISNAEASGRIGGSAKLTFSLASITLANGNTVAVRTRSYSREGRAHVKHNATYIAGGGVLGALAGQAIGHDRDSTAKGAAIGAGVGIAAAAGTGKFDFSIEAGHRFSLKLRSSVRAAL
ncbi:MAG: hypothetical protein QOK37_484 [Thermoanaerobaculia bacterium]|jgi:hypothetical protein|nr:hypothetical protein [Thermoanaerobaculia bacterium]